MSSTPSPLHEAPTLEAPISKKHLRDEIKLFDGAISLLIGALASVAILVALGFGAREIWSSFTQTGSNIFRGLAISGLAGGLAAAVAYHSVIKREASVASPAALRILSPAACALGWGLLGLSMHTSNTKFFDSLPEGARNVFAGTQVFLNNGAWQALSVALGLMLSAIISWMIERRFFAPQAVVASTKRGKVATTSTRDDVSDENSLEARQVLPAFSRNMSLPLLVAIPGFVLLCVLGLIVHFLPQPNANQLPAESGRALLAAVICALSFGVASFGVRRSFGGGARENSLAYVLAAPIVIAFVCAMFLSAQGQIPILRSAVDTVWNSSPFEAASWGAFGSAIGFWLSGRKTV